LLLVGLPAVEAQQPPFIGAELLAGLGVGQHRLHRAAAGQAQLQHLHHLGGVGLAGQAGDLVAGRVEQDQGRVAAHLEAGAELLRAGRVAVDAHGHEGLALLDEVRAVEQRGLELVAGRAPLGAPVQQHRLLLGLGLHEVAVDVGIGRGGLPADAGPAAGVDEGRAGQGEGGGQGGGE